MNIKHFLLRYVAYFQLFVIKSFFSMIVGHPCYDIVPVASNLIQARFRTHKIQEKKVKGIV